MKEFLEVVGYITTIIVLLQLIWGLFSWFQGTLPALIRLGKGLSHRGIVVFSKTNSQSLKSLLLDSKIFKNKNIELITSSKDLGKAENYNGFLIDWEEWKDEIPNIVAKKKDSGFMVIYAPPGTRIPNDIMTLLDSHRNVSVCNFRGRLLNDITSFLITTSYE